MIKIAIIVSDDEFSFLASSILSAFSHPGIAYQVINAYGTNIAAVDLENPDIILARGLTGGALRKRYPSIVVLEMPTSAQDILYAVNAVRKIHSARKVLILGAESMSFDVDLLRDIVAVEMRLKRVGNEDDIVNALKIARMERFDAVVGGFTACKIAQDLGWDCAYIRTSDETFRLAVTEAMKTAIVMFTERAKTEIYRSILNCASEGIAYFDRSGTLAMSNRRARDMLSLPGDGMEANCRAETVFGSSETAALLASPHERRGVVCNVRDTMLIANFTPVLLEGEDIGRVCTFQPTNEIQAAETIIRKAINKKGLIAKYRFADIIHASPAMEGVISVARKYAGGEANILLVGETGTGKELFAQSIHNASRRSQQPFVAINCAAFPDSLLDSELFGYADGAFSGAVRGGKAGLFERAHGGTIFLDEVGEIPLNLQPKLLRALEEREIRRIGDDRVIPVDVRIVAATNLDIWNRADAGSFRSDLLHRLDVLSLRLPALRERPEDVRPIAEHYLRAYRRDGGGRPLRLEESAWKALRRHAWPGNTRELRNVCERLAIVCDDAAGVSGETVERLLRLAGSRRSEAESPPDGVSSGKPQSIREVVRMVDALRLNRREIAALFGVSRATLFRRLKEKEDL